MIMKCLFEYYLLKEISYTDIGHRDDPGRIDHRNKIISFVSQPSSKHSTDYKTTLAYLEDLLKMDYPGYKIYFL